MRIEQIDLGVLEAALREEICEMLRGQRAMVRCDGIQIGAPDQRGLVVCTEECEIPVVCREDAARGVELHVADASRLDERVQQPVGGLQFFQRLDRVGDLLREREAGSDGAAGIAQHGIPPQAVDHASVLGDVAAPQRAVFLRAARQVLEHPGDPPGFVGMVHVQLFHRPADDLGGCPSEHLFGASRPAGDAEVGIEFRHEEQ